MNYISHRGNIKGKNPIKENSPSYINAALDLGYDVEVDVWECGKDGFLLGHDGPEYPVDEKFLLNNGLWCHAKNIGTLKLLVDLGTHCFFHEEDSCVLTSRNRIWVYPGMRLVKDSIAVLPETIGYFIENLKICGGICSDLISEYRRELNGMECKV